MGITTMFQSGKDKDKDTKKEMTDKKDLFERLKHDKKFIKQQEKLVKLTEEYIKSIPDEHHHPFSLLELSNVDIDYIVSISNRGDGKTFSNFDFLIEILAFKLEILTVFVSRTYIVRDAYVSTFTEMFRELDHYDEEKFSVNNTRLYIACYYDSKLFALITDLNSVTNLKYKSTFLKRFSLIAYDEFLALEGDYLPDEYERLRILYSSMDRNDEIIPYIGFPKTIFLGNPENFSSPVLTGINIFRHLEKHPLNTVRQYGNTILQMTINEKRNDKRNTRAYSSENSALTTGQFVINSHNIIKDSELEIFNSNKNTCIIRLEGSNYLYVYYYFDKKLNKFKYLLSVMTDFNVDYDFNLNIKDNNFKSIYLNKNFYNDEHFYLYNTDYYLFLDNFSKDFILNNYDLATINIKSCVRKKDMSNKKNHTNLLTENIDYEKYYLSRTKKYLVDKFSLDEHTLY